MSDQQAAAVPPRRTGRHTPKEYLGDGVFAAFDEGGRIVLTAENGLYATNTIYLEGHVYKALQLYVSRYLRDLQG